MKNFSIFFSLNIKSNAESNISLFCSKLIPEKIYLNDSNESCLEFFSSLDLIIFNKDLI